MFRMVRRRVGATVAVGAFALVLAACAGGGGGVAEPSTGGGGDGTPQAGGTAIIGSLTEMPGFDPVRLVAAGTGIERAAQVMDTLMYRDDVTDEVTPKLAKSLESDDGRVWVLTLREGVDFTDGTPLDAAAVVFNLERHIAPDSTSPAKAALSGIEKLEATGELEVTVTLHEPSGSFPLALTGSSSASLIGSPKALADPDAFNSSPVGAGPFVFKSWVRDSELKVIRNDAYWDKGKPYLDALTFRVLVDSQSRADAVVAGGVTLAQVTGTSWAAVEANPSLVTVRSSTGGQALVPNASRAPADDERVRRAIGLATDPKVANTIIFPGSDLWDENRDCIPFPEGAAACLEGSSPTPDMDEAKKLIADYVADGGDPTIDFMVLASTDEYAYYHRQMTETGLDVKLRVVDYAGFLEESAAGNYGVLGGVNASAGYPTHWRYLYSGGRNWGGVVNEDLDEALLRARDELELDDRNAAWRDVAEITKRDAVLFWTAPYSNATSYSKKLHLGTEGFPFKGGLLVYFGDAWMEQ